MGGLGWSLSELHNATPRDVDDAIRGFNESRNGPSPPDPMTRDDLERLKQEFG
ncbi:MAG: hypothetical protein V7703_17220 [Hyphomicrobiales bacterium]